MFAYWMYHGTLADGNSEVDNVDDSGKIEAYVEGVMSDTRARYRQPDVPSESGHF